MGELFYVLDKGFQRLLRWVYPGILFLILWYVSNPNKFIEVVGHIGFPSHTIWGLIIGGIGIGAVIYLLQAYIFTTIISSIPKCKLKSSNRIMKWFDSQAGVIREKSQKEIRPEDYMDYSWSIFHALCMTVLECTPLELD